MALAESMRISRRSGHSSGSRMAHFSAESFPECSSVGVRHERSAGHGWEEASVYVAMPS
jgi:hypothetical protein